MEYFDNVAIVIPAYNPDRKLTELIGKIINANFKSIIIVNDGSKEECKEIFDELSRSEHCTLLNHAVNLGKGRALKTAFNYFLNTSPNLFGVITIDSDGQHSVTDMIKIAKKMNAYKNNLILGSRDFSLESIPFRSRFGNILTRHIFRFASGIKISDTQTGLRGIPTSFIRDLMNVKGERFEFEMNMLLECKERGIQVDEVKIETIYIEENKSSHFNPIIDSIKIYSVFLKYLFSSLFSFGLDILLFSFFLFLFKESFPTYYIISATISARILSSLFNYTVNRNVVFKTDSNYTIVKYYTLSICQMLASAFFVYLIYLLIGQGEIFIKIVVDTLLFLVSFYIQREWVFKSKQSKASQVISSE
ncbi:glycosyltransferase [Fredinandcohnia onubensis]|uniref:glycosyltransferase n=1 Tax=Fredinandcohnia onubensis TaxID=1571209 RepID=UPI000C0BF7CF|nr:glycosyltransferase [Fredinandcohnia onubensis]